MRKAWIIAGAMLLTPLGGFADGNVPSKTIHLIEQIAETQTQTSARETLTRFCEQDAQGGQLTEEGWRDLSGMFVRKNSTQPNHATVVSGKCYVGSPYSATESEANFMVDYTEVARIDLSGCLIPFEAGMGAGTGALKLRVLYRLVRNDQGNNSKWKIVGSLPEPLIAVETALRYVAEVRAKTRVSAVRKNADITLAFLRKLQ